MAVSDVNIIVTPVPPNNDFLPMTLPTNPATRLTDGDIILEPATEADLWTIVLQLLVSLCFMHSILFTSLISM